MLAFFVQRMAAAAHLCAALTVFTDGPIQSGFCFLDAVLTLFPLIRLRTGHADENEGGITRAALKTPLVPRRPARFSLLCFFTVRTSARTHAQKKDPASGESRSIISWRGVCATSSVITLKVHSRTDNTENSVERSGKYIQAAWQIHSRGGNAATASSTVAWNGIMVGRFEV